MSRVRQLCSVGLGGAVLVASVPVLLFGFSPTGQANARDEGGHCGRLEGYNHTSASCEIFGGCHTFCPRNKCQCTSQCINIGNCCHDYVQYCVNKKHSDFELLQAEMKLERMEREGGIIGSEWIFSLAMIFFIFTMILLIFLVNSKHTSIQHSVYRVMCTTVSIFAASTSSVAVHGIVIEQLWQGKHPGLHQSAGPLVQARIYLVLTLLFYLFSNWCTHYYFRLKQEVFAVAELMSHMTGFMLIRLVGSLQQTVRESELKALTVVLVVFVLLRVVVDLAEWAREKFAATDAWHWQFALSGSGQWNDLSHRQSQRLEELRVQQAPGEPDSDYTLLRPISVLLEAEDDMEDPDPLARFGPMRCALSSPSFCAGEMRRDEEKEGSSQSWQLRRHSHWDEAMQTGTIEGAALAIGFLVMQSVVLFHTHYLHSQEGLVQKPEYWWEKYVLAGWGIAFGVLFFVATILERNCSNTLTEFLRECFSASMGFCFVRMAELTARPYCSMMDTSIIVAFPLTWAAFIATALIFKFCDPGDEPDKGPVPEDVAHLLHSAANSCGIIVGLAWDKAFESLAINMTAGWNGHYVISKCVLATVVWASVVPTWLWYLVPQEKKLEHGVPLRLRTQSHHSRH